MPTDPRGLRGEAPLLDAWLRFQEIGAELAGANRERFLRSLDRDKQRTKAARAKARSKSAR